MISPSLVPSPNFEIEQLPDKNGEPRHYAIDGERVPSVTTILRVLDKPALVSWAWNLACEGGAEVVQAGLPIESQEEMKQALVDREWGWWQVRDTAGLRGQRLHDALHALISEGQVPSLAEFPEDERGYVQALAAWWTEHEPEVLMSEVQVGSKRYRYAGRLDLLVASPPDQDYLTILDIKSAKPDKDERPRLPYLEHHFQVGGGYRLALSETYNIPAPRLRAATVSICENGTYRVTPAFAGPMDFLYVLNAYLSMKRVAKEMGDYKKADGKE
jgi:hypothetical protein